MVISDNIICATFGEARWRPKRQNRRGRLRSATDASSFAFRLFKGKSAYQSRRPCGLVENKVRLNREVGFASLLSYGRTRNQALLSKFCLGVMASNKVKQHIYLDF
jgi:hypothetical protein